MREQYNPSAARDKRLYYTYGLTQDEYELMVSLRFGKCDICGVVPPKLFIDHDHGTGEVRGLLCSPCNTSLGGFKDSIDNLKAAIKYLEFYAVE